MSDSFQVIIGNILRFLPHIKIVNHVPGKIKLKLLPSIMKLSGVGDIGRSVGSIPGIRKLQMEPTSSSVIIEYDQRCISPDLWQRMAKLRENPNSTPDLVEIVKQLKNLWGNKTCAVSK